MPSRIQRQRTKGWRAPLCSCGCGKNAIYVGRGTKWGNPYRVVPDGRFMGETTYTVEVPEVERRHIFIGGEMERDDAVALAIDLYRRCATDDEWPAWPGHNPLKVHTIHLPPWMTRPPLPDGARPIKFDNDDLIAALQSALTEGA